MPLPTISVPKYQLIVPSSKKVVTYRPFLVKEQKILLMALESQNTMEMLRSMCNIIKNCAENIDNPETMPMFDIEYIFAQIRAKSVGEAVDVGVRCPECDTKNKLSIQLDSIEVKFPENISNKIMLTDELGIILRYPSISDNKENLKNVGMDDAIDFICNSIDMVFDKNTTYTKKDFTQDEIREFVESLNATQMEQITKFYNNLPYLTKEMDCHCKNCEHDFKINFQGLQDFFT